MSCRRSSCRCRICRQSGAWLSVSSHASTKATAPPYAAIVICDIHMSPIDGFNLLKHVRALPTIQNKLPFIFLTSNANAEFIQNAKNLTVDAYLLKPIAADHLKNKMIDLLTRLFNKFYLIQG